MIGALGGFFFSAVFGESVELLDYLQRYFQLVGSAGGAEPSPMASVWDMIRWPLFAFLLGYSAFGAVGLPLLMAVRGFMLSFAAATFVRLLGLPGLAAALVAFGLTALIAIPVLFVVSRDAFRQSLSHLSGSPAPAVAWPVRLRSLAPCLGLLVLAAALQQTVMPALLTAVCAHLFAP